MLARKIKVRYPGLLMILLFSGFALGQHPVVIDSTTYYFDNVRAINIEGDYVQGGPHNEFPIFFDSTVDSGLQDELRTVGNGGEVQCPDGYDIVFADQSGNQYAHEIELYEPSSGKYIAWVKVNLTGNDQTIYLYYGSTDITDEEPDKDTQHVTAVWDSDYVGVWHLNESPTGTVYDSTDNDNDGTPWSMTGSDLVNTPLGKGFYFDGNDSTVRIPDPGVGSSLDITNSITMQTWLDIDTTDYYHVFLSKGWYSDAYSCFMDISREVIYYLNGVCWEEWTGDTVGTTWQFLAITWTGSQVKTIIDDSVVDTRNYSGTIATTNEAFWIASMDDNDHFWGILDEVRLSKIERTVDWLRTEYNNQKNPGTFYGIEPTLIRLSYFRAKRLDPAVLLEWATESELENEGFNLWRSEEKKEEYVRINPYLIPSQGEAGFGAEYSYTDYDVQNGVIYYYKLEDINIYGASMFHGPVPAIPNDIILIWPIEREKLPSGALLFSWASSGDYVYKVEISPSPSFSSSETLSFPEESWAPDLSLWIKPEELEMILRRAQESGGQLFWRARAMSEDSSVVYSHRRRFFISFDK